jgi:hypothetical protein
MSAHASIWLCVALAALVFALDTVSVIRGKRAALKKLEWEEEK